MLLWSFEGNACGYGRDAGASTIWAVIAAGIHLFPFRTEKLSPPAPMVLGGQARGGVGRRPPLHRSGSPSGDPDRGYERETLDSRVRFARTVLDCSFVELFD